MRLRAKNGITLVEVLVSIVIFLIGILALLTLVTQGVGAVGRAGQAYTAYSLAASRLETLRATAFGDLTSAEETDVPLNGEGEADPDGDFFRTTDVTPEYTGDPLLTQVKVSVKYRVRGALNPNPMEATTVIYNG